MSILSACSNKAADAWLHARSIAKRVLSSHKRQIQSNRELSAKACLGLSCKYIQTSVASLRLSQSVAVAVAAKVISPKLETTFPAETVARDLGSVVQWCQILASRREPILLDAVLTESLISAGRNSSLDDKLSAWAIATLEQHCKPYEYLSCKSEDWQALSECLCLLPGNSLLAVLPTRLACFTSGTPSSED